MGLLRGDGDGPGRTGRTEGWIRTYAHEVVTGVLLHGRARRAAQHDRPGRAAEETGGAEGREAGSVPPTESRLSGADGRPGHDWEDRYLAQRSPPAVGGAQGR